MLTILLIMVLLVFALPLLLLLILFVAPSPLFAFADRRVYKALDVDAFNKQSPYSQAGFLPVHRELSQVEITVEGEIPTDFDGVYIRNGTNTQFEQTRSRVHMFNGAGMLHQVQIRDGVATYSNTYIRTPRYRIEHKLGREVYPEFGDFAGGGKAGFATIILDLLKKRFGAVPKLSSMENASSTTAIQYHHGKLYCLQETAYPFALSVKQQGGRLLLDGTGDWDTFDGQLDAPFTAHPKIDPITGAWYSYSTELANGKIRYSVLQDGKLARYCELLTAKPALSFLHDYFLTQHFSVFPDVSLRFDGKALMGEHESPFYFDPDHKMRFGVIKREHEADDAVQWFVTKMAGHIWHTINGWEEQREDGGTDIVLYAPVFPYYPSSVPIHTPQEPHAQLYKFRLNLDSGEVTEQRRLEQHFYERPSYNTQYIGKPSRYAYLLDEEGSGGVMGKGVMKYDLLEEKEIKYFDYGECLGGEALFVPKTNASAEDDGYLVDLLMNEDRAYLVIIDARTMEELAKLHLPQRVPYGVHACWLNEEQLQTLFET